MKGRRESTNPLLDDNIDQNIEQPKNKGNFGFARNATSSLKRWSKRAVANSQASRKGRRESTDPLLDTNINQNIEQPQNKGNIGNAKNVFLKRSSKMSTANFFEASPKGRRESTDHLLDDNSDQNIEQPKIKETLEMQEMLPLLPKVGPKYP